MTFEIGDMIEHNVTGSRRVVTSITPAGAMGTKFSDGPTFHATTVGSYGQVNPRGHTVAIWSGSMSYPTRDWTVIKKGVVAQR